MLRLMQVGINTADVPGSLRLYSQALGYENAGAQMLWADIAKIQGLSADARTLVWWMLGGEPRFQLEFFQHTVPTPQPKAPDWRPSDGGWVRLGFAVADFDKCVRILVEFDIPVRYAPDADGPNRRLVFRDPFAGVFVEVFESPQRADTPALVYATSSVGDIASARDFYHRTLGFDILPLERLHVEADEALWGLPGAQRDGFLVKCHDGQLLEIVQYSDPPYRPRPSNWQVCDQGIANVGIGASTVEELSEVFERLAELGLTPPHLVRGKGVLAGYLNDAEREIELFALPEAALNTVGYQKTTPFLNDSF